MKFNLFQIIDADGDQAGLFATTLDLESFQNLCQSVQESNDFDDICEFMDYIDDLDSIPATRVFTDEIEINL